MASKYDRLRRHLNVRTARSVVMSFRQVEEILGGPLPASAGEYTAWSQHVGPLFATTGNENMKRTLRAAGFAMKGNSWQGQRGSLTLWIRSA